jgi:cytochrome c-type biogenesis protein
VKRGAVLNEWFVTVHGWITGASGLAAVGSFLWGLISVLFSPCHLASIPLMVSYVAGQETSLTARHAARYSVAFTGGLFTSIAFVGAICSVLGRMLGEVGPYWTILVGVILIWVALDMMGVGACSMGGGLLGRLRFRGLGGALALGLAYGILSGSCTFGFIAPILALITLEQKILTGMTYILLFALGHCLPVVVAGSSTALVKRLLANTALQQGTLWFRRSAGLVIGLLGIYFTLRPFLGI